MFAEEQTLHTWNLQGLRKDYHALLSGELFLGMCADMWGRGARHRVRGGGSGGEEGREEGR